MDYKSIYLDYNATTPIDKRVSEAMKPYLDDYFGNPSSMHEYGIITRKAVENARNQIAQAIHARKHEVIFTSGGTESNNYAIKGCAYANRSKGNHIICSSVEHPAVLEVFEYLKKNGFETSLIPADEYGRIHVESIKKLLRKDTILVSVMHANNEVGTIQPIEEIAELLKNHQALFHVDAAQSMGKIPVDVKSMGVDLLSIAGHKLYAPKGIGALYIREGVVLEKLMHGADHEQNMRAGTENVLEIVGLGKACELISEGVDEEYERLKTLRDRFEKEILGNIPFAKVNGHPEMRLPNTSSISFENMEADLLLTSMDKIAASAGAACHTDDIEVSTVLEAMKVPIIYAMGTIRFSLGRFTTEQEIDEALEYIIQKVRELENPEKEAKSGSIGEEIKLTHFTHGLGCACKIRPQDLEQVLKDFKYFSRPEVLIGPEKSDDAAVFKISEDKAIIQTLDFFTPVVDDPYSFGAVAASNALSDIYAMGADPIFALNIVAFPVKRLPLSVLEAILAGANDKAIEAGIPVLGGHSIEDNEPKFGMAVSGLIHPDKVLSNDKAQSGDHLILTKAIGVGILSTACKRGLLDKRMEKEMIELMSMLNKSAAESMKNYRVHAVTDITGFGLLGHLREILLGSKLSAEVYFDKVPLIEGAFDFASSGIVPGGTKNNLIHVSGEMVWDENITETMKYILADAQTSGGLLMCVDPEDSEDLLRELHEKGIPDACIIGKVVDGENGNMYIRK